MPSCVEGGGVGGRRGDLCCLYNCLFHEILLINVVNDCVVTFRLLYEVLRRMVRTFSISDLSG